MSTPVASYAFLPWLRRGLASDINLPDGTAPAGPRARIQLSLFLDAAGERREIAVPLALHGPGEVGSIDPRVVIRTMPRPDEIDAEPSYFVAIEFDQADFPWRYTAASADAAARLRPWLVLAVVTAGEVGEEAAPGADRLAALTIANATSLPDLSQSWAWAHGQIDGFDAATETIETILSAQPRRARSRLLCPRRLQPNTAYRALLVPAFDRGRRAGLGEILADSIDALAPAWSKNASDVRLPIYFEWRFQTGAKGDFETLGRRLAARPVDDAVGRIDMDVRAPDPALPAASAGPLAFEGALIAPKMTSTAWPPADRTPFVSALAGVINQPTVNLASTGGETTVAPPLWARWHAAHDLLATEPDAVPRWFHELNADPRHRAAAGLGAEIVRQLDEQLMAAAWDQVEGIDLANAELRRAQLTREAAAKLHQKHLGQLGDEAFLQVTSPLHARFTASPHTVRHLLRASPIPDGALDGQLRRVTRPQGALGRRAKRLVQGERPALFARLNSGSVRARPSVPTPTGILSPDKIAAQPVGPNHPAVLVPTLFVLAALLLPLALLLALTGNLLLAGAALAAAAVAFVTARRLPRRLERQQDRWALAAGDFSAAAVQRAEPAPAFVPAVSTATSAFRPVPIASPGSDASRQAIAAVRSAFSDLADELTLPFQPGAVLEPADLPTLNRTLFAKMNPRVTVADAITHRLQIADWVTWTYQDPLEPIMVAPEFDTPMYEPLRDYGEIYLMPGVGTIPPDTITLVKSNQRFIEAYMAGLNHEMARELLYHEFPTDQRGTYFRQFWDVRGALSPTGVPGPETLKDITRMNAWRPDLPLGNNSGRNPPLKPGNLVFLVKGELLRRYPDTLVYAVRTVIEDGRRTLGTEEKFPAFEGRLSPDICFFGFDLVEADVDGHDDPAADQGWYFLLQERPTEPVFGLDADDGRYGTLPPRWSDLNWAQLAEDAASFEALTYIDLDAELPDTTAVAAQPGDPSLSWHATTGRGPAGANSSDLAHITLQRPFRIAIHGSDMLPRGTS